MTLPVEGHLSRMQMKEWQSQAHVKWECKYHVVIVLSLGEQ